MPPVVAAAAIGGGAALAGSAISAHSNSNANKTQAKANSEAIAMAKDNEARRRQEYDRAEALSKAQWDAEQQRLEPLRAFQNAQIQQGADRLGFNIGQLAAKPYPGSGGAAVNSQAQPRTLAQLAGSGYVPPGMPNIQAAPQLSIADIANWGSPRRMS